MSLLAEILSSRVRASIFEQLFVPDFPAFHMRELERRTSSAIGTIQSELKKLHRLELVERSQDGNRVNYRANRSHPLCPVICDLVSMSSGAEAVLRDALHASDQIRLAFIFGSAARGELKPESDIDLLVIGSIGLRELMRLLSGVSDRIGREINPHVMPEVEFAQRIKQQDHFVTQVLRSERIYLLGGDDEFRELGG